MRKHLLPLLVVIPPLIVFWLLHRGTEEWGGHYMSYLGWLPHDVKALLGIHGPYNAWDHRVKECGGWFVFWREAWCALGVMWIFALLAWGRSRLAFRVMFVIIWFGCFAACMVSHDKARLWYRMSPVVVAMVVMWIDAHTRYYMMTPDATYEASGEFPLTPEYRGIDKASARIYWRGKEGPDV